MTRRTARITFLIEYEDAGLIVQRINELKLERLDSQYRRLT